MKIYRTKTGPFTEKPFFKPEEIDRICTQELIKYDLYPTSPEPIRIDRFVEKRFKIQPQYEDLPNGLLGFTLFGVKGVEEIFVAKSLDEEGTKPAERRLRTTLAHECGHGLLHAHLFALNAQPESLFGDGLEPNSPKILCRDEANPSTEQSTKKSSYRWYEFQANLAMGALLLPKSLVETVVSSLIESKGVMGFKVLEGDKREKAIRLIAETFNVNPVVARIRLEGIYPRVNKFQLTL